MGCGQSVFETLPDEKTDAEAEFMLQLRQDVAIMKKCEGNEVLDACRRSLFWSEEDGYNYLLTSPESGLTSALIQLIKLTETGEPLHEVTGSIALDILTNLSADCRHEMHFISDKLGLLDLMVGLININSKKKMQDLLKALQVLINLLNKSAHTSNKHLKKCCLNLMKVSCHEKLVRCIYDVNFALLTTDSDKSVLRNVRANSTHLLAMMAEYEDVQKGFEIDTTDEEIENVENQNIFSVLYITIRLDKEDLRARHFALDTLYYLSKVEVNHPKLAKCTKLLRLLDALNPADGYSILVARNILDNLGHIGACDCIGCSRSREENFINNIFNVALDSHNIGKALKTPEAKDSLEEKDDCELAQKFVQNYAKEESKNDLSKSESQSASVDDLTNISDETADTQIKPDDGSVPKDEIIIIAKEPTVANQVKRTPDDFIGTAVKQGHSLVGIMSWKERKFTLVKGCLTYYVPETGEKKGTLSTLQGYSVEVSKESELTITHPTKKGLTLRFTKDNTSISDWKAAVIEHIEYMNNTS